MAAPSFCKRAIAGFLTFNEEPDQYLFAYVLRPGNASAGRGAIGILSRLLIKLRADSAAASSSRRKSFVIPGASPKTTRASWSPISSTRPGICTKRFTALAATSKTGSKSCIMVWKSTAPVAAASSPISCEGFWPPPPTWLYQEMRLRATRTTFRSAQVRTLREHLIKLGARMQSSVRRIVLHLPATCPHRNDWQIIARSVGAAPA
jgi:Transposase DDE domain group 1